MKNKIAYIVDKGTYFSTLMRMMGWWGYSELPLNYSSNPFEHAKSLSLYPGEFIAYPYDYGVRQLRRLRNETN